MIRTSTGQKKDTLINIEREKEFVVNFVTEANADQINLASTELAYGEDEFEYTNLTPVQSDLVKACRLKESPIHFECKLRDIVSYGDQPGAGTLITGEVLKIHADESILSDTGRILTSAYKPMGRGAGNDWYSISGILEKERLTKAQIQK